ncbi:TRIP11 [Mytilus coruscus]|uniref:TRIP11 n=1 Tax=Mytilus coruscus TaxID=42192 RepID=A0A6J8D921_MYTCO|nr:TRIP11 [Mytilus coruscus]
MGSCQDVENATWNPLQDVKMPHGILTRCRNATWDSLQDVEVPWDPLQDSSGNVSTDNKHQKEKKILLKKLKEVSQQLEQKMKNHQHEVASLQDVHHVSGNGDQQYLVVKESAEWMQLEEKLKSLELDHNKLKRDHEIVCKELKHAKPTPGSARLNHVHIVLVCSLVGRWGGDLKSL